MAYCDRCMSFLASKNGKQMKLPALGEAEVDSRRGAYRGGWRSALSLVPHRTTAVTRNATASPLVDWFSNGAAVMPSTSIRKMEYDLDRRTLSVWFVASGKRYEFEGVPPETFAAFRAAFAKGRYFNDQIRNNFRYRVVASDSDPG
ncbi:KTSC domain-containing protein [Mesorhizobium sp. M1005]|uniref:KTSC domain-containing protein n=1 Tax=unclassified Mesorhizobium TaxID=325217 RepID=UPI0033383314